MIKPAPIQKLGKYPLACVTSHLRKAFRIKVHTYRFSVHSQAKYSQKKISSTKYLCVVRSFDSPFSFTQMTKGPLHKTLQTALTGEILYFLFINKIII